MNLLAHLYIAEQTHTSAAGQLLGDLVKGRLDGRYDRYTETGIRLHRRIDGFTDHHPVTARLRSRFAAPLRRYGGILVDIGFDYCLARQWARYSDVPLATACAAMLQRAHAEWPQQAPVSARRFTGLEYVLASYQHPDGLQHALDSVAQRLHHANPLASALPTLMAEQPALETGFDTFFPELCRHAMQYARPL